MRDIVIPRYYCAPLFSEGESIYALNEACCVERGRVVLHLSLNLIGILNFLEFGILSSLTIIFYLFIADI